MAKGPDRNDNERKFITALSKQGMAAQADGSVIRSSEATADADAASGGVATKRQQPKRQPKSKRQTPPSKPSKK